MTQAQAIERGYTHFIEVWRDVEAKEGVNVVRQHPIDIFDAILRVSTNCPYVYTVCIFLIKPKPTHS